MRKLPILLLVACALCGCSYVSRFSVKSITGSGKTITDKRYVSDFNALEVEGAYDVTVECGQPTSLEIQADDNIMPLIKTELRGSKLVISSQERFNVGHSPVIKITAPDVRDISLPGASNLSVSNVKNDSFSLSIRGASSARCSGETKSLSVSMDGAGSGDLRDLRAENAKVSLNGAGQVLVFVTGQLDAKINGVGTIDYYGNPKTVNQSINGIGTLNKK
jgi:hypothetical protein